MKKYLGKIVKNQHKSRPFTPPDIVSFLKEQYWSINEAAHVLTEWPKDNLHSINVTISSDGVKQKRTNYYLPDPHHPFDPNSFGPQFYKIFLQLKKSVETGIL